MSMLSFANEHHEAFTLLFLDRGSRPLQIGGVRSARLLHDYARLRTYENFRICRGQRDRLRSYLLASENTA
jgi:hypothetical protein